MLSRHLSLFVLTILSLCKLGADTFEGVYSGIFNGVSQGNFVAAVQPDNTVIIWGYDATWDEGFRSAFTANPDGSFSGLVSETTVNGSTDGVTFSGSGTNTDGSISFSGTRRPDTGPTNHFVGCFSGAGTSDVFGDILIDAIVAADGAVWFYSRGATFQNGGLGTLNASGTFSVVDVTGTVYTGSVNGAEFSVSGNFNGGGEIGNFSLQRKTNFLPSLTPSDSAAAFSLQPGAGLEIQVNTQERRAYSIYRGLGLNA